ncbi:unnamed protein product, partial [Amoebophrya sp. A120]
ASESRVLNRYTARTDLPRDYSTVFHFLCRKAGVDRLRPIGVCWAGEPTSAFSRRTVSKPATPRAGRAWRANSSPWENHPTVPRPASPTAGRAWRADSQPRTPIARE